MATSARLAACLCVMAACASVHAADPRTIEDYGALGDGRSHPLSSRFASLGEAQKVYPRARSLSEELDRHSLQKAIDQAPVGGTVLVPADGCYVLDATIKLWKGITVSGAWSVTERSRPPCDRAQLRALGSFPMIEFDETAAPPGQRVPQGHARMPRLTGLQLRGTGAKGDDNGIGVLLHKFWLGEVDHCHFGFLEVAISANGAWVVDVHHNEFDRVGYALRADPACAPCGNSDGWYEVNALRFHHNDVLSARQAVALRIAGHSISIYENTIEHVDVGVLLAGQVARAGKNPPTPLRGVTVRDNYFESGRDAYVQLGEWEGSTEARKASAPADVFVTNNQFNFDHVASCVRVFAADGANVSNNSVRNGAGKKFDIEVSAEQRIADELVRRSSFTAERGVAGTLRCGAACLSIRR